MTTHYRASCPAHDFEGMAHHDREDAELDLEAHRDQTPGPHTESAVIVLDIG